MPEQWPLSQQQSNWIRSTSFRLTFCPDSPSVALDDPLHSRHDDTVTRELFCTGQTLEWNEELICMGIIETDSVVVNETNLLSLYLHHAKLYAPYFFAVCVCTPEIVVF